MSIGWGCFGDDVELWGECYNIEETTELDLFNNQLSGLIPPEIGNLTNLQGLDLGSNQLTGEIPGEICNQGDLTPHLDGNQLCPPYPDCGEGPITLEVEQDTSNCEEECSDSIEGDLNYDGIVNIIDVVSLVNCILSDSRCDICFDINYDGEINVVDIISLVNIILDI